MILIPQRVLSKSGIFSYTVKGKQLYDAECSLEEINPELFERIEKIKVIITTITPIIIEKCFYEKIIKPRIEINYLDSYSRNLEHELKRVKTSAFNYLRTNLSNLFVFESSTEEVITSKIGKITYNMTKENNCLTFDEVKNWFIFPHPDYFLLLTTYFDIVLGSSDALVLFYSETRKLEEFCVIIFDQIKKIRLLSGGALNIPIEKQYIINNISDFQKRLDIYPSLKITNSSKTNLSLKINKSMTFNEDKHKTLTRLFTTVLRNTLEHTKLQSEIELIINIKNNYVTIELINQMKTEEIEFYKDPPLNSGTPMVMISLLEKVGGALRKFSKTTDDKETFSTFFELPIEEPIVLENNY